MYTRFLVIVILGFCCPWSVSYGQITVERKNIVDNGGYVIRNAVTSNLNYTDLVMILYMHIYFNPYTTKHRTKDYLFLFCKGIASQPSRVGCNFRQRYISS